MDELADAARAELDAAVAELYAGDPSQFVVRRDALAREARGRKDRPLANALKELRRPTVGAWYVNVASRASLTSLVELLQLGNELRGAASDGDFKRVVALAPQRAALERRVLRDLTAHLSALGITATASGLEEVRSTLRASLERQDAADAVRAGALDKPLVYGSVNDAFAFVGPVPLGDPVETDPSTGSGNSEEAPPPQPAEPVETQPFEPVETPSTGSGNSEEAPPPQPAEPVEVPSNLSPTSVPGPSKGTEDMDAALARAQLRLGFARASVNAAIAERQRLSEELRAVEDRLSSALSEARIAEDELHTLTQADR